AHQGVQLGETLSRLSFTQGHARTSLSSYRSAYLSNGSDNKSLNRLAYPSARPTCRPRMLLIRGQFDSRLASRLEHAGMTDFGNDGCVSRLRGIDSIQNRIPAPPMTLAPPPGAARWNSAPE